MTRGNHLGDVELTDPQAMRALAHPVRLAILEHLRRQGPSTATELAPDVGATPSVTSWHLRHLAGFGLVRDAEPGPDRRARRWEAVGRGFRFDTGGDGEGGEAARALAQQMFLRYGDLPQRWITEVAPGLTPEWRGLGGLANTRLTVSADELAEIEDAIERILAPYATREPAERPADSRGVRLMRYVLPEAAEVTAAIDATAATAATAATEQQGEQA
ncbi:helix-turn-helix domain-containing protein [Kitasatospora sp. NBC_01287]|uniref:helix-turn-helix domain-containing protein n=1 Tax=Kitasatospora sp. NBC_01287 TaxID=2903573 RepID=UPI00224F01D2|nr:helix-turn-helix domain-containing protein [Kitasatospora sp. NBC_01287]MCX4745691.1 helix-turn-helix domain-containing protein [Kitasatospora sp. NBC_01287]